MSFYSVKYACRFLLISFILSERAEKRKICPNAAGERRSIFRGQTGSKGGRKRQDKKVCTMFQTKRQPCRHEQKKRADEAKGKTAGRSDSENLCRLRRGEISPFVRRRAGGVSSARPSAACPFPARRTPCGKGGKILLCPRRDARAAPYRLPCRCVFTETAFCFLYIIVAQARKGRAICGQVRRCPLPAAPPTPARRKRRARR